MEQQALMKPGNDLPMEASTKEGVQNPYLTTVLITKYYGQLMALAKDLVATGFLPQAIKTPAQAVAIILTGYELGLPPMKALRLINVIQGKPNLAAELQLALFKQRGGRATWLESTEEKATIHLVHPNGDEHTETFTMEHAKKAKLLEKVGGNWTTYPKIMLRWRAASNGLKAVAPDILSGVYDPDELGAVTTMEGDIVSLPIDVTPPLSPPPPLAIVTIPNWKKDGKPHPHAGRPITELPESDLCGIMEGLRVDPSVPSKAKDAKYADLLLALETELDRRIAAQTAEQPAQPSLV